MPNTSLVLHFLGTYGPLGLLAAVFIAAVGIGAPIPVTALLLTLGTLSASSDGPSYTALALASIAGISAGHTVDYWVGRLGSRAIGNWIGKRYARATGSGWMRGIMRARGGQSLLTFLSRFLLTPIASLVSLLAGATRMRFGRYTVLEVAGTAIYVLGNLTLGRAFGPRLLARGGTVPVFWLGVGVLTLLPVALVRLATALLDQRARRMRMEPREVRE